VRPNHKAHRLNLMQVAMMSMLRDGDFLIVLVRDKDGNLKIQGIEADRLGDPFRTYTSLDLIGGIHIDGTQEHPPPTTFSIEASGTSTPIKQPSHQAKRFTYSTRSALTNIGE
jgi:hypothetical protein